MEKKIIVGVFWVCDDGGQIEIVWDSEKYSPDWRSDFGDEFILYEKTHKQVWKGLSEKQFDGKYAGYKFGDFPRGRVSYDSDDGVYMVDYDKVLKPYLSVIKPKLMEAFGFKKAVYHTDGQYKSKEGAFNK